MSPYAGSLLLQIMPIIRATVMRTIKPVGCEDHQEIVQDATAMAANMLDSSERNGKALIPKSVAFYAVQAAKSGRRSTYAGRSDAFSYAAHKDGRAVLVSMDEPLEIGGDDKTTLGDMLADKHDDPATLGARNMDWDELMGKLDHRSVDIVVGMAQGMMNNEVAKTLNISAPRVCQIKRKIAGQIKEEWGDNFVVQTTLKPAWRRVMENNRR